MEAIDQNHLLLLRRLLLILVIRLRKRLAEPAHVQTAPGAGGGTDAGAMGRAHVSGTDAGAIGRAHACFVNCRPVLVSLSPQGRVGGREKGWGGGGWVGG